MALRRPKLEDETTGQSEPRRYPAAIAAASAVVDLGSASSWKTWKFGNRDWQTEAWRLYDIIPELHFLAGRIGDSIAKARLYVTEVSQTGEGTGEVEDEVISRLAAIPLGTGAQRDDSLRLAGIDLAVAGECWIVGEGAAQNPEMAQGSWFVVTSGAIKRDGDHIKVRRPQARGGTYLVLQDGVDILTRCWRQHPNDTDQADSFTRPAIVPLREIELLTKREFAELDSRLTGAGIWFLPEGMDFPRGPDDPEGLAGFMAYVQRAAAANLQDQGRASSMVPIMASVPDQMLEHLDKLKPVTFWSELSDQISPMKDKAITRVASVAELPAEVLTGLSGSNHWSAWLITEEGTNWINGYLGLIADALTRSFLVRALESMGVANPDRFAYAFDVSGLAARPNRMEDATQLHDRFLISDEEMVKAGAFDIEQMPTIEQRAQQLLLKVVQTQPDLLLDPAVQAALGLPAVTRVGLPPTADQNTDGEDDDGPMMDGPPNNGEADPDGSARAITAALDKRIGELTAHPWSPQSVFNASAKLMVYRALELAGGRLTTPAERRGRWADVPRHELHARVGPITPDKADKVTIGAWTHIGAVADDLGVDAGDLERLLRGYVNELLTRGMAHHDDLLYAALSIANRGRGLGQGQAVVYGSAGSAAGQRALGLARHSDRMLG